MSYYYKLYRKKDTNSINYFKIYRESFIFRISSLLINFVGIGSVIGFHLIPTYKL